MKHTTIERPASKKWQILIFQGFTMHPEMEYLKNNRHQFLSVYLAQSNIDEKGFFQFCRKIVNNQPSYICGSVIDGCGNSTSDIDIFIIKDNLSFSELGTPIITNYQGLRIDVECINLDELHKINSQFFTARNFSLPLARISNSSLIKMNRFFFNVPVVNSEILSELRNQLDYEGFWFHICRYHMYQVEARFKDSLGAYLAGQLDYALMSSRKALDSMIDTYLAINGETDVRLKHRVIFLKNLSPKLFEAYHYYSSYWPIEEKNLEIFIKESLTFIRSYHLQLKKIIDSHPSTIY